MTEGGPKPIIEVCGVSKIYGGQAAIDNVSLAIEDGEFLSIIGPSGSGKSTLLKMMINAITPTTGHVLLRGREVTSLSPEALGIVMVWQSLALFPHMSVAENVGFGLAMRKVPNVERDRRVARYLEIVDLQGMSTRSIHELSGGEQQRVALARALIIEPQVLLLDEPMGGLDKHRRAQMLAKFREIHRLTGVTVVMVTHDQTEAMITSSRVAVLNQGRIAQIGSAYEISRRPTTAFVAGFVGHKNVLRARVDAVDGDRITATTAVGRMAAIRPSWLDLPLAPGMQVAYVIDAFKVRVGSTGDNRVAGRLDVQSVSGGDTILEVAVQGLGSIRCEFPLDLAVQPLPAGEVGLSWATNDAYILPDA